MTTLFLSWDCCWGGNDPRFASLSDDVEALRRQNQAVEAGRRCWESWLLRSFGTSINFDGAAGRASVPADQISALEQIRQLVGETIDADVGVGVGLKLHEADLALKLALKRGGNSIVFYTDDVPKQLEEKKDLVKTAPGKTPEPPPENSHSAGGGFVAAEQPQQQQAPAPEASEHSQGEAMASTVENQPQPAGDYEQQFSDGADASARRDAGADAATKEGQQRQDLKQQVVQILQDLRQQAPQLQQLQQLEPEVFAAIQGMTKAMLLMAKQLLGDNQVQKSEDLLTKSLIFTGAAFRAKDGRVVSTGAHHDIEQLPPDFEIHSEGFLGRDGHYYDRQEAAALAGLDVNSSDATSEQMQEAGALEKQEKVEADPGAQPSGDYGLCKDDTHFRSRDGLKIPTSGSPGRRDWDKKYNEGVKSAFGHMGEMKAKILPISSIAHMSSGNMVVAPARYNLYRRMLAAGDRLPPIVVRRNGLAYDIIDGSHRIQASLDHGADKVSALELVGKAEEEMLKAKLPLPENAPKFTHHVYPVGTQKDTSPGGTADAGKVKIQHGDGKTGWVSVRAGQVLSQDGHAVSVRNSSGK